jgi:hypothetical protein
MKKEQHPLGLSAAEAKLAHTGPAPIVVEHPGDIQAVKCDLTRLFEILDLTETSGDNRDFHPVRITCVREQLRAEVSAILASLKTWARSPTPSGIVVFRYNGIAVSDLSSNIPLGSVRDDGAVMTTCGWRMSGNVWVTEAQVPHVTPHGWAETGRTSPFMGAVLVELTR